MTVARLKERMDARFKAVDRRFDAVDKRFDANDRRSSAMDRKLDSIGEKLDAIARSLHGTLDGHFKILTEHENRLKDLEAGRRAI